MRITRRQKKAAEHRAHRETKKRLLRTKLTRIRVAQKAAALARKSK